MQNHVEYEHIENDYVYLKNTLLGADKKTFGSVAGCYITINQNSKYLTETGATTRKKLTATKKLEIDGLVENCTPQILEYIEEKKLNVSKRNTLYFKLSDFSLELRALDDKNFKKRYVKYVNVNKKIIKKRNRYKYIHKIIENSPHLISSTIFGFVAGTISSAIVYTLGAPAVEVIFDFGKYLIDLLIERNTK